MRFAIGMGRDGAEERLEKRGVSRRDFLKFCTAVAVTMGMGPGFAPTVAGADRGQKTFRGVSAQCGMHCLHRGAAAHLQSLS